jgi:hypothetical protein
VAKEKKIPSLRWSGIEPRSSIPFSNYSKRHGSTITDVSQVTQLCFMIDALVPVQEDPRKQVTGRQLECLFLQALYCSLGASLQSEGRAQFDEYTKKLCGLLPVEDSLEKKATIREFIF